MWICDRCEQVSAMSSREDVPPGFWVERGEEQWCPDCVKRLEEDYRDPTPSGVALSVVQRFP